MLFVWLMSLGLGVANACLLQPNHGTDEYFGRNDSGSSSAALAQYDLTPDPVATNSAHTDKSAKSPEKIACLHFCVAEQSTLVTDHANGLSHLDLVPVSFLTGLLVRPTDQPSPAQAFASPTWSEPPVSIRYLRLTI